MKARSSWLLSLTLLAACGGAAPRATTPAGAVVTVEPLTRTLHSGDADAEVTIRVPRVTVPGDAPATAAINGALGVPTSEEALAAFELQEAGLDFTVGYNRDGLLDLSIVHETLGAYPDSYVDHFLFDTETGARLTGADVLALETTGPLVERLDGELQAAIARARAANPDCVTEDDDVYGSEYHVTADHLKDVGVSDGGAVFTFDFDFPHVVQACEPDGTFTIPFADLKPYVKAGGAFTRVAR